MKKRAGRKGCLKRIMMILSAFIALSIPITALADGNFAGNITITKAVKGYEYKVYEVLECIGVGGEDSLYMSKGSWKEFLSTNENAVAMLTPVENDGNYTADEGSDLYTVNMETYKEVRQAFATDALEYAKENGIDAYESITAEESEVTFEYVPLGIYVIDTADKARITVMWDMDWESEIKESYKPETKTADTSTETVEKTETQKETADNTEENSADEDISTDTPNVKAESEKKDAEEVPKADSVVPVIIVIVAVVLTVLAVLLFVRKKK